MELLVEPDTYTPSIDANGNYIDKLPSHHIIKQGMYCVCGSRCNKLYDTPSKFNAHLKTKTHQKWLEQLNLNKANFFVESEKLKKTVHTQQVLIARLEQEVRNKSRTIDYMTQQLTAPVVPEVDLLDIHE